MSSTLLYHVCGSVIHTSIINIVDGISVVCGVWQIEFHADNMTDGKTMYTDDTT